MLRWRRLCPCGLLAAAHIRLVHVPSVSMSVLQRAGPRLMSERWIKLNARSWAAQGITCSLHRTSQRAGGPKGENCFNIGGKRGRAGQSSRDNLRPVWRRGARAVVDWPPLPCCRAQRPCGPPRPAHFASTPNSLRHAGAVGGFAPRRDIAHSPPKRPPHSPKLSPHLSKRHHARAAHGLSVTSATAPLLLLPFSATAFTAPREACCVLFRSFVAHQPAPFIYRALPTHQRRDRQPSCSSPQQRPTCGPLRSFARLSAQDLHYYGHQPPPSARPFHSNPPNG
ncbi:hypothetical protein K491DRAFT_673965 [Lophiostoma macrostomum CBS 122681]|uniref:Secreted protein n=1 Tax=Lophiostoma macrostomum CBS 122681 TaxID=1314788 RepID=A0A6A6TQR1_9PLEO|nr:hypothetical protein K491DRAFT_673965 [Lophiostoma macrostomum CBS 122681]